MTNFEKYKDKGITGLTNCGNTCFLNSCMQVLSHTYELNDFLSLKDYIKKLTKTPDSLLLTQWDSLRELIWSKNCTIAPHAFIKTVQKVAMNKKKELFTGYEQNDIQEFLLFIIDCFHTALAREVDMEIIGKTVTSKDILARKCYEMMSEIYKNDYSEMIDMFYGIHISEIKTNNGEVLSVRPEPFTVLSIPIPNTVKTPSIMDCMVEYCKSECLDGENAYYNEKTKKKENVTREIGFWNLPNILIIDLKRWNFLGKKNATYVNIPLEILDLSRFIKGYNSHLYKYELFGVCNHMGNTFGGHYTAHIRNANRKWYEFNDTNIREISESRVITQYAYCLFYRKIK